MPFPATGLLRPWRSLVSLFAVLCTGACHVGYGFRGPGFDPGSGAVRATVPQTVVVAVTTGVIASGKSGAFFDELDQVMQDLTARDGLVGYSLRKQMFGGRIWTLSAWVDDASLDAFLGSAVHQRAVRDGGVPRASLRYVRVRLPADQLPLDWDAAIALLPTDPD